MRSVILAGHGIRAAGCMDIAPRLLESGYPILSSWQAADIFDNSHPRYYGRPGIYGQRAANKILYESEQIIAIGNRLSVWNIGYEPMGQDIIAVDCDTQEMATRNVKTPHTDIREFIENLPPYRNEDWLARCDEWKARWPWLDVAHEDNAYINSYRFTAGLRHYFREDEIIVTDMGAALCSAFQVLKLKPPQRLMTSGGLGEMGCALPAAIGAAFATAKPVLCLHCDGGMMLNLQELATIQHHKLPIRIIVYCNDGYLMLKNTQTGSGMQLSGVDKATGITLPDFRKIAVAFDMMTASIRTREDYREVIPKLMASDGPALIEYHMDPMQPLVPKLAYGADAAGNKVHDRFDCLSPKVD